MLTLTPKASEKVASLLQEYAEEGLALRIFVSGGGCAGLQYGMALDPNQREDDFVIETPGFKVLVDAESGMFLEGAEIDYIEGPTASGFSISNPKALDACAGCHAHKAEEGDTSQCCP